MEAFVTGFVANVLASVTVKVGTLLIKKSTQVVLYDAKVELKELEEELVKAQTLFDNLRTIRTWQCKIADVFGVCYDIEDLVDDLMADSSNNSVLQKIKRPFKGKSRSTRKKIQDVRKRLEEITSALKVGNTTQQQEQQTVNKKMVVPRELLGRKEEKEEIIRLLLDDSIRSVNIVGIGGLGKTTLAWDVQFDPRIQDKFQFTWVPVPDEFDLKVVAEYILQESLESKYTFLPDKIRDLFEKFRAGKSVLIVLDGLHDVTYEDWTSFSSLFLPASAGCKVLITTHNPRVALKTGVTQYHLPLMRDEECQDLVIKSALYVNSHSARQHKLLQDIAGAIAQMSKGLPLAASVLGQSLSSGCREYDSITLSNEDIYHTREFKEEIFPVLKLNTANMRSHLNKCLAYCSLFPPNYHIKRDSLVELWMAEGFILPQGKRSLRHIGIEYFNDLYERSFFQPSEPGEHEISSYKMHEFIHRFAELVASGICFRWEDINSSSSDPCYEKVRHLSLLCTGVQLNLKEIMKCDTLRTFLRPTEHQMHVGQIDYSFFEKLRRLRVLDLSHTDLTEIPGSLGILKLLRYLDLSETHISSLPESISKLLGLQVLKLKGCVELLQLPTNLHTLTSLVHLDVDMQGFSSMPSSVGNLIHLQTLPKFFVGEEKGYCISELKNLKLLRGTLNLVGLENVEDEAHAREANLCEKKSLKRLELEWISNFTDTTKALNVFAGLEPHKAVHELKVTNYVGSSFPTWLTRQSCTLASIHVKDCSLDDVLPTLGQLRYLENLHLEGMPRVKHMSGGAFPSLKSLKIKDMEYLTSWHILPDNCMLKLSDLTIMDCPRLSSIQSLNPISSLQTLEINRCPALQALPQLPPSIHSLVIIESNMVNPEWYRIKSIPRVEIDYKRIVFP